MTDMPNSGPGETASGTEREDAATGVRGIDAAGPLDGRIDRGAIRRAISDIIKMGDAIAEHALAIYAKAEGDIARRALSIFQEQGNIARRALSIFQEQGNIAIHVSAIIAESDELYSELDSRRATAAASPDVADGASGEVTVGANTPEPLRRQTRWLFTDSVRRDRSIQVEETIPEQRYTIVDENITAKGRGKKPEEIDPMTDYTQLDFYCGDYDTDDDTIYGDSCWIWEDVKLVSPFNGDHPYFLAPSFERIEKALEHIIICGYCPGSE